MIAPLMSALENYLQAYRQAADVPARQAAVAAAVVEENRMRRLYAQDRDNEDLNDLYRLMVPVHANMDLFVCPEEPVPAPEGTSILLETDAKKEMAGKSSVVPMEEFTRNWELFSESALRYMDWSNVFAAGKKIRQMINIIHTR